MIVRHPAALLAALLALAGCAAHPTPYQPRDGSAYGYEESRLQEDTFRVSFKGNRYTEETAVLDYVYLRCAELALANGYSHFKIQNSFGKVNVDAVGGDPQLGLGLGYYSGFGRPFWTLGGSARFGGYSSDYRLNSNLAVFVVQMSADGEAAERDGRWLNARQIVDNLKPKAELSRQQAGD